MESPGSMKSSAAWATDLMLLFIPEWGLDAGVFQSSTGDSDVTWVKNLLSSSLETWGLTIWPSCSAAEVEEGMEEQTEGSDLISGHGVKDTKVLAHVVAPSELKAPNSSKLLSKPAFEGLVLTWSRPQNT